MSCPVYAATKQFHILLTFIINIIIIGSTALGGPWPPH
jgi:hypothetical protein